jgi:hypothetical protein
VDIQYSELPGTAQLAYAEVLDNALTSDINSGTGFTFLLRKKECKGSDSLKLTNLGLQPKILTIQLSANLTLLEFFR